jgi:tricorn protease-like protein
VYVCPGEGGAAVRLTHLGAFTARVAAWTPDGRRVLFATDAARGATGGTELWWVPAGGGCASPAGGGARGLGPAASAAFQPRGPGRLLGRHTRDPAVSEWKRYGGGRGGELWVDAAGAGAYACVLDAERLRAAVRGLGNGASEAAAAAGSLGAPAWAPNGRIVFAADPGGAAGVYSCAPDGADVRCHAAAADARCAGFYPRHVCVDGAAGAGGSGSATPPRAAFAAGGRLYTCSLSCDGDASAPPPPPSEVPIAWRGPRVGRALRYVSADDEFESAALHPEGLSLVLVARGRAFSLGLWAGPALAFPPAGGADANAHADGAESAAFGRARFACFLFDGARVALACDASGEDDIHVHWEDARAPGAALALPQPALGRPEALCPSPQAPLLAIINHRAELLICDVDTRVLRVADVAPRAGGLADLAWSPCGNWLAYSAATGPDTCAVKLLDVRSGVTHVVTAPLLSDGCPAWDPAGRYLYFVGARDLEPSYDEAERVGLGFPHASRPYVLTLRADTPNPLLPELRPPGDDDDDDGGDDGGDDGWEDGGGGNGGDGGEEEEEVPPEPIEIDLEGITARAVALPVPVGRYGQVLALERDRLMFTVFPVHTSPVGLNAGDDDDAGGGGSGGADADEAGTGTLLRYDLRTLREATLIPSGVEEVSLSMDGRTMAVHYGGAHPELRVLRAGEKPREEDDADASIDAGEHSAESGLIDIEGRVRIGVRPAAEWRQMLREVWRRLRDDFWCKDMGGVDWAAVRCGARVHCTAWRAAASAHHEPALTVLCTSAAR